MGNPEAGGDVKHLWVGNLNKDVNWTLNKSGWWFEPLWKILVNWADDIPNINGKIEFMATSYHQPEI